MQSSQGAPPHPINDLKFIPVTNNEEYENVWIKNRSPTEHMFPGNDLVDIALDQMLEEAQGRPHVDHCVQGRFQTFLVTVKDDPSQPILATCGLFQRWAIVTTKKLLAVQDNSAISVVTKVQQVPVAVVGPVFSPSPYRGCGYDEWLLLQLWSYLEMSSVSLTVKYGVVKSSYGWKKQRSAHIVLTVSENSGTLIAAASADKTSRTCKPITDKNLSELLQLDASLSRDEHLQQIEECHEATTLFSMTLDPLFLRWLRARDVSFFQHFVDPNDRSASTSPYGVYMSHPAPSLVEPCLNPLRFILWIYEFQLDQLMIIHLRHGLDKNDLEAKQECLLLLEGAMEEARRWRLSKVAIWNPHPTLCIWTGLEARERPTRHANLGICQGPNVPEQDRYPTLHVRWI